MTPEEEAAGLSTADLGEWPEAPTARFGWQDIAAIGWALALAVVAVYVLGRLLVSLLGWAP